METCLALVLALSFSTVESFKNYEPTPAGFIIVEHNSKSENQSSSEALRCSSTHILVDSYFCPDGHSMMSSDKRKVRLATDTDFMRHCYIVHRKPFGVIYDGNYRSIIK